MHFKNKYLAFLIVCVSACMHAPVEPPQTAPATGTQGMVSSAHPLATEAGLAILAKGGTAFDAAVAIAATLNVVEPMMSGIGGYGTIVTYAAETGTARFLNASGRIPVGVDADAFRAPTPNYMENRTGPKAISTPGNVPAWAALHEAHGNQSWASLFESAIQHAEEGYAINELIASWIGNAFDEFPPHAQVFYGKDGRPLEEGEHLIQKDLAQTFRRIATEGPGVIHGGDIGQVIAEEMQEVGSFLALEDLQRQEAEWWEPIRINYRGYEVITASPPATAFPSLVRLGLMSQFDVAALGHNSVAYLHHFAEATKHAFWTRLRYAGDPEISPPPLDLLLAPTYWAEQACAFDLAQATPFVPPTKFTPEGRNTTHFVVADQWGNVVSATQTLGNLFGSRIMPEGTGIWLNNSLAYCTFEPAGNPMDAHAGHHKLSGDCPTLILREGKPWVALGTPGGHTIGQTVPQMVMNLIDFDMNIQAAISAPRISFIEPDRLAIESTIATEIHEALQAMGHQVRSVGRLGNAHGLSIEYDAEGRPIRFFGGADPRGQGLAKGW